LGIGRPCAVSVGGKITFAGQLILWQDSKWRRHANEARHSANLNLRGNRIFYYAHASQKGFHHKWRDMPQKIRSCAKNREPEQCQKS
jgi:hypothetical protein